MGEPVLSPSAAKALLLWLVEIQQNRDAVCEFPPADASDPHADTPVKQRRRAATAFPRDQQPPRDQRQRGA